MPITLWDLLEAKYAGMGAPGRGEMRGIPERGFAGQFADWVADPMHPPAGIDTIV